MSSPPFKVKAVFEYTSPHDDDLHFPNGQIITVTEEEDDEWYVGEYVDAAGVKQEGIFPRNFVEKYEPVAPARPTRASRPKKEVEPAPAPPPEPIADPESELQQENVEPKVEPPSIAKEPAAQPEAIRSPPMPKAAEISSPPPVSKPAPIASKHSAPPPADKPSGNSFRDRIAAFNKAAPPPAPFKPGGLSSGGPSSFIKKPFVAPPPSKNAYVPTPREPPPQKLYRRDEDPEISAREADNLEQAEKAGLVPSTNDAEEGDQPKPLTLKERMALLQKQQAEQASRHADAAAKKEKPKRPAKKRTESHNNTEGLEEDEGASLERQDTADTVGKTSMDAVREEPARKGKPSKGVPIAPGIDPRKSFGDGNEADMSGAGDTTEEQEEASTGHEDSDEKPKGRPQLPIRAPSAPTREPDVGEEEGASEEDEAEEDEEEDDIDPEVRRKEELRARMAKMSGGMGMHGMFGAPMPGPPPPRKKKSTGASESRPSGEYGSEDTQAGSTRAPPVPMPGLSRVRSPEEIHPEPESDEEEQTPIARLRPAEEVPDVEDVIPDRGPPPSLPSREGGAPPIPSGRPAPPPIPLETRPVPNPPTHPMSPSAGSESDDELSERPEEGALETPTAAKARTAVRSAEMPASPQQEGSYFSSEPLQSSPETPGINKERRASKVPPIPGATPLNAPQNRAPPPPPPAGLLSRSSTGDHHTHPSKTLPHDLSEEEEVTEYEGDYDTDIASAAPHKDALKAHAKDSSNEDQSTKAPALSPPPPPSVSAPRAIPPPLPSQPPPHSRNSRSSVDMPRAAPPPPPPSKMPAPWEQDDDDEYDPYRYSAPPPAPKQGAPSIGAVTPTLERRESDLYSASPPRPYASPPQNREPPPPPPRDDAPPARAPPRQSLDVNRTANSRRSTDLGRMSMETGYVANDVDLARTSFWWTQPKGIPPVFQGRKDILLEFEESTSGGRGAKTTITKEVYILFQDYSQTIITAEFDAQNPGDIKLEQKHEQPPSRLRQDQLEQAHEQFGREIFKAVTAKKETVVGDGTPQGLVQELLKPFANALLPVGTRAYGAIVYGNLANASTQQNDEIRPGDIITLRNTKFQGKHGPMHAKYSMEVGKPDHVGVVAEWDGTKKKVRAWEQGRESKKVKLESFKLDDLRSGEVKIWRVMPRSWVGWEGQN